MNEDLVRQFKESQEEINTKLVENLAAKFNKQTEDNSNYFKTNLDNITSKINALADVQAAAAAKNETERKVTDQRLDNLEKKIQELQRNVGVVTSTDNDVIKNAVKEYVDNSSEDTWKANLSREVFEHEHGVVVHGLRIAGNEENTKVNAVKLFLKQELKASDELINKVRIRDVIKLGSDSGEGKPPPVLIKFGHPSERNQILPLSANLKKGFDMDKNIPKKYQSKHREFKKHAWKLKLIHGVQAQVIFDEYNLILRYKRKDEGTMKYN